MPLRNRSLRALFAVAALVPFAAPAPAVDRTVLSIGAHAGDAEITSGVCYADNWEDAEGGALAGKRLAIALEVGPFAKKRVLDSLP